MDGAFNGAVILGDNFVAKKLRERLEKEDIRLWWEGEEMATQAAYVFDFEGNEEIWRNLDKNQKLVVVAIDDFSKISGWREKLKNSGLNWRIVGVENVYGPGMPAEGFLGKAIWLAAKNQNLVLPSVDFSFSTVAVDDVIEAIMKACFLSGNMGKTIAVTGKMTNTTEVAKILFDLAKMTKQGIVEDEEVVFSRLGELGEVEMATNILRWEPEIDFHEGVVGVVAEMVGRVDEENRLGRKKKQSVRYEKPEVRDEEEKRRFVVEVEEESASSADRQAGDEKQETRDEEEPKLTFESLKKKRMESEADMVRQEEIELKEESLIDQFQLEQFKKQSLKKEEIIQKQEVGVQKEEKKESNKRRVSKWVWWGIFGLSIIGLGWGLIATINLLAIPKKIEAVQNLVEEGKYDDANKEINKLKEDNQKIQAIFPGGDLGGLLKAEKEGLELVSLSIEMGKSVEKIRGGVFNDKAIDMQEEIKKSNGYLIDIISKMGLLEGRLSGSWEKLPKKLRGEITKIKNKLSESRQRAESIQELLPIVPEILGVGGKRREYMMLLQNENELRAGGGFIGSYAILSFEDGKFINFEVKDIYESDGQLKGHVEPPEEIKKYLGEATWYMRDANWKASFPAAAEDVLWFLEKETGRRVDGVIGINLSTVKAILKVVGEIYVPDFKEKVSADSLYQQAEYYSENKFFPGSVQKASFLGGLSIQLMEEIKNISGSKGEEFISTLIDLMDKNEIQTYFKETSAATVMKKAGWDGSIFEGTCSGERCLADYLYVVESNFGVNKVNYFIKRKITREIKIETNEVTNDLTIYYENTSRSREPPGGDYKNYVRIYLPLEAEVGQVMVKEEGKNGRILGGEDLNLKTAFGKKEVGFLVTVEVGKKAEIELKYRQKINLSEANNFSYLSYVQRQSGFGETPMKTEVNLPTGWVVMAAEPQANVEGQKIIFDGSLEKDVRFGVEMSR